MTQRLIIDFNPAPTNSDNFLRDAQLIADAFAKAMDDNECNVKVLIGVREQLADDTRTLKDLTDITRKPNSDKPNNPNKTTDNDDTYVTYPVVNNIPAPVTQEVMKRLKERCYDCDFNWPKISFDENLDFSYNRLRVHLDMYKASLKGLNPNFCHVSGAMNWSCLHDLIKLITLLLSAYSAILALRKISGISLSAFIKGVISGLLAQVVGNIRLQVDLSQTGLACLIKVLEEIANNIPDGSSIYNHLPPHLLDNVSTIIDKNEITRQKLEDIDASNAIQIPEFQELPKQDGTTQTVFTGWKIDEPDRVEESLFRADTEYLSYELKRKEIFKGSGEHSHSTEHKVENTEKSLSTSSSAILSNYSEATKPPKVDLNESINQTYDKITNGGDSTRNRYVQSILDNFKDPHGENFLKKFTKTFKEDVNYYEQTVSNAFKYVNDTINQVIEDFNANVAQIFGLIDHFQCEAERTGPGYIDILDLIQRIANVINLISSIIAMVARKQIQKLCKTQGEAIDPTAVINDVKLNDGTSNDIKPTDIVSEFLGKVVVFTNTGDDIVPIIYDKDAPSLLPKLNFKTCNLNEFINAHRPDNIINTVINSVVNNPERPNGPWRDTDDASDVTGNPTDRGVPIRDVIDRDNWKEYPIKFVTPPIVNKDWILVDNDGNLTTLNKNDDDNYGLDSILDLVYNNPITRSVDTPTSPDDVDEDNKEYRNNIVTPFYSTASEKEKMSFENKCRDISDVLDLVGSLRGIK